MKNIGLDTEPKIASGFKIPDDYLLYFEHRLMEQIESVPTKKRHFFRSKRIWVPIVAAVFLVVIAFPMYFNLAKKSNLDHQTIENYLVQDRKIETDDLLEHLSDDDISNLRNTLEIQLSNEEIDEYLTNSTNL